MSDFSDAMIVLSADIAERVSNCSNEEQTKQSLILPFLQLLGYNIFSPAEVEMEYSSDDPSIKVKNGKPESVDYAIKKNGQIAFFIEAKKAGSDLSQHQGQLFRYFVSTVECRHAILTNGTEYQFFSDLDNDNVMDQSPYRIVDMLALSEDDISFIDGFRKKQFSRKALRNDAERIIYAQKIKEVIERDIIDEPSDDFVKMILGRGVYDGVKNASVLKRFRPLVKEMLDAAVAAKYDVKSKLERSAAFKQPDGVENPGQDVAISSDSGDVDGQENFISTEPSEERIPPFHVFMKHNDIENDGYFEAEAVFLGDGNITVLKGSQASPVEGAGCGPIAQRSRQVDLNGEFKFSEDTSYTSVSTAACVVRGGAANGWYYWKTEDGKRLDDVASRSKHMKKSQ